MLFNLNEFLMSISFALDFVELDLTGATSNHSKRVSYICYKLGENLGLTKKELYDLTALAILHDNGISEKSLHDTLLGSELQNFTIIERKKEHCTAGENNINKFPFYSNVKDVLLYHHENCDGTGFFNILGNDIPLMSQIIHLADILDITFDFENFNNEEHDKLLTFMLVNRNIIFFDKIANAFLDVSTHKSFWLDLKRMFIATALKNLIPEFSIECTFKEIRDITKNLSRIIDSKSPYTQLHSSGLAEKAAKLAVHYGYSEEDTYELIIAADLHDIGKLAMPSSILEAKRKLTIDEYEVIKEHSYYTRIALQGIKGFDNIVEWASNHHEKLNGEGYPYGKDRSELDFNSRLLGCLDIYQALTEDRPYRASLNHKVAMRILTDMKNDSFIDSKITEDIDYIFS
ncbi:HD-GYP domain-containing protein [Clostridium lacusfryxellense]|uniref:HD-GYP domain-containing protein n=1 Tax=Clostridium lacusfryxellense TaxID=205328 RepID=UPI001C0D6E66|nr:HD domain-containing phosphohydrolase [Clostridium lacusfryxellense]MBU3110958.1 HD domain-containing protein [Clostridium lacusfryxellense]